MPDLDLYLMPVGKTDPENDNVWSSVSGHDSVEHIFFKLPKTDQAYEIWVVQRGTTATTNYGLAWWTVAAPAPPQQQPPGKVEGRVWQDGDCDGIQDTGEAGVAHARVDLYDTAGAWINTTTTDDYGDFSFESLEEGDYFVEFTNPTDTAFTAAGQGSDPALDSEVDADGLTVDFTVGTTAVQIDAGLVEQAFGTVGDLVWDDLDGDGVQDVGESGLADAVVYLYDASGHFLDLASTDEDGHYQFADVEPGDYYLRFETHYNYRLTTADVGSDTADSDAGTDGFTGTFTVGVGQDVTSIDAGMVRAYAVTGLAWDDADGDGVQDGEEGALADVTVRLLDEYANELDTTVTDDYGGYAFAGLESGDYIIEFGSLSDHEISPQDQGVEDSTDSDIDSTTRRTEVISLAAEEDAYFVDAGFVYQLATVTGRAWDDSGDEDGVQEEGEEGWEGVTVRLLNSTGTTVVDMTTSDEGGHYVFTGIAAGEYRVEFVTPSERAFTLQDQGGQDDEDSDADPGDGRTDVFGVDWDQDAEHLDAGFVSWLSSIRGKVTLDNDMNGVRGGFDGDAEGITVYLLDASLNVVDTTESDSDGEYAFTDITPGDYYVEVVPYDSYHRFTDRDVGSDNTIDSDFEPDTPLIGLGMTATITLGANQDLDHIDAGLIPPGSLQGTIFEDTDQDGIHDVGESGVAGVWVHLYSGTYGLIASVQTDSNGDYAFDYQVPAGPGFYVVVEPPNGATFTQQNQGYDDMSDSDVDGGGVSDLYGTWVGGLIENLDAGIVF